MAAMEGFDGAMTDVVATVQHLDAPLAASVAWTGVISTSFTIWLCTEAFKHLPSVDASLILTSEPLWAALVAAGFRRVEVLLERWQARVAPPVDVVLNFCTLADRHGVPQDLAWLGGPPT